MTTQIQQQMINLQRTIFDEQYYVQRYLAALGEHKMSTASIDQSEFSDTEIVDMCNTFWLLLPDSPAIRSTPFFKLCNIAEYSFD